MIVKILWGAGQLFRESFNTLLEGVPRGILVTDVEQEIKRVDGVVSIHDLHIWSICSHLNALSGHVLVRPSESTPQQDRVLEGINWNLKGRLWDQPYDHPVCGIQSRTSFQQTE